MKTVMISIHPKWVEKIVSGEKTIEVRKNRPKLETPFKCFIYCTKGVVDGAGRHLFIKEPQRRLQYGVVEIWSKDDDEIIIYGWDLAYKCYLADAKVIGEFVCDRIVEFEYKNRLELVGELGLPNVRASYMCFVDELEKTCLTYDDLWNYGKGKTLYGWHISDLKIYDKPKMLDEFRKMCKHAYYQDDEIYDGWFCKDDENGEECPCFDCPSCGGESYGYEDFAYCMGKGLKPIKRPPKGWCYVEE